MRYKLILIILAGLFCRIDVFAQQTHFTPVPPPKDQPWTSIYGAAQDRLGYLWLWTDMGTYKYDGHQYTIYQHDVSDPSSIASNSVMSIYTVKDGTIWLGTVGTGLDRFDPATGKFTHYRHQRGVPGSLSADSIPCLLQDRDGVLWVGTGMGLDKFDPKTNSFIHFRYSDKDPASLSNNIVSTIYEDREGILWIGTGNTFTKNGNKNQGGLNRLDKKTGKFTRYLHNENDPHSLIDSRITALFEDSRGTFWVGTGGDGLHTMNRKSGTFERYTYDPAHPEKLSRPPVKDNFYYANDRISFINEDITGKIWIGTLENGINVYDPATQKTTWYSADPKANVKINRNEFMSCFRSRDGVLWIAPFHGMEFYKVIPYDNQLPYRPIGPYVNAFAEDNDGTVWMTSGKGLLHKKKDNSIDTFAIAKTPPPWMNNGFNIEKDAENNLWVTNWQGLYKFNRASKTFTVYYHQNGNPNSILDNQVMCLKTAGPGKLWVGTQHGLQLMDTKNITFKNFVNDPKDSTSISFNLIQSIAVSKNGDVWVSTDNGVNRLDPKTQHFKRYMMNITTRRLVFDSHDELWAGTDQGLYKYDKKTDNFLNSGKHRAGIGWLSVDKEDNLWLHTDQNIAKFNPQTQETIVYGKNQGVSRPLNFGYTLSNGDVLAGDSSGYFDFNPDKALHNTPAPMVVINSFTLADIPVLPATGGVLTKPIYNTTAISLNHNQATFSFSFTGIDFTSYEGANQVFYMLENYDRKWLAENPNQTANYYNVPPGDYIFKVKSINGNGLAVQKEIIVTIAEAWYKTIWAILLFIALLAAAIWAFVYYRSIQLINANKILEQKVQSRTEEVVQQKEEIESQRDGLQTAYHELKAAQKQLIQSEKMASLGELTAGIAHEIQNPLNFVNNFSEVSKEMMEELREEMNKGDIEEANHIATDIEQNLEKINHHGKRADAIVKGMLQHSRVSTGERQMTSINSLADEYVQLSYHGLRAKDKAFNAEIVTALDPSLPEIEVVAQDIGRVLLNLFNNAFYAVAEKTKTAVPGYAPAVIVKTEKKDNKVMISVTDNGNGIPKNLADKIFQPFFTTKPPGQGTGLGLSISYDIVKAHEGELTMESKEEEGSVFVVMLPC